MFDMWPIPSDGNRETEPAGFRSKASPLGVISIGPMELLSVPWNKVGCEAELMGTLERARLGGAAGERFLLLIRGPIRFE
jgi:hypothetical protein